jgi:subtilisin family serine protease
MDKRFSVFWKTLCISLAVGTAMPLANAAAASDPLLINQWALADPAAIGAKEAWTQSSGAGVLVAILDTGVQLDHPDLAANIWTNTGEIAGNGRDDDADGFVDDVHGANMFDRGGNVDDDNGHGTHVAGIVAARQGNGIGGSGVAPNAKILPVKVLDANMSGNTDTLSTGIRYAVDRGAKIINTSVNTDAATDTVRDAVAYADEHGAVIVASAGNNGRDIDLEPSYPASLSDPAVFAVAAQDEGGLLSQISNTGLLAVDVAAPGVHIASTTRNSSYQSRTGTSAAAPFVAGSFALLSAARPDLPMSALRSILSETTKRTSLLSSLLGGGQLDVGAAMHRALAGRPWKTAPAPPTPAVRPTLSLSTTSKARAGSRVTLRWRATAADKVALWRVSLDGRVVKSVAADAAGVSRRVARAGRHAWRVVGFDAGGAKVVAASRTFRVARRG